MDPVGCVYSQNVFVVGPLGLQKILVISQFFAQKRLVNQPEFLRGENVRPEVQVIVFMVNKLEWERSSHEPVEECLF
jgi:hypothetical protein